MPSDTAGNTLINAVIGAVVSVVTSFVPFSPILGGAVAAYLEEGTRSDAARVGALSGLLLVVPFTPILLVGVAMVPFDFGLSFLAILVVLGFAAVYAVGFSALGGFLAAYVLEFPVDDRAPRADVETFDPVEKDRDP